MTSKKKAPAKKAAAKKPPAKKVLPAKKPAPKVKAAKPVKAKTPAPQAPKADEPLTDLEELFCRQYLIDLNGTQAYMRTKPGVKPESARVSATRLLAKTNVQAEIKLLRDELAARLDISAEEVLRDTVMLLRADSRELSRWEVTCCRHCFGKDHRYQRTELEMEKDRSDHEVQQLKAQKEAEAKDKPIPEYEEFDEQGGTGFDGRLPPNPDCENCWGRGVGRSILGDTRLFSPEARVLYAGVKQGKDGIEVKTHSVDAARERLFKHFGLFEKDNEQQQPVVMDKEASEAMYAEARATAEAQRAAMIHRRKQLEAEDEAERKGTKE